MRMEREERACECDGQRAGKSHGLNLAPELCLDLTPELALNSVLLSIESLLTSVPRIESPLTRALAQYGTSEAGAVAHERDLGLRRELVDQAILPAPGEPLGACRHSVRPRASRTASTAFP